MPRRPKAPRKDAEKPPITILPIQCVSCGKWSHVRLPGPAPWAGATFDDKTWSVLNDPKEGHVVFACGPCFEKELSSPIPKIRGKG